MTRAELDILLCDYVDGTLVPEQRALVERHLAEHPMDAEFVRDAISARDFLAAAPAVETPPELLTRILFDIRGEVQPKAEPEETVWSRLLAFLGPVLQPRFAMGMAMTILSISMLGQLAGIRFRQLTADDLRPAAVVEAVENRAHRVWDRAVKFYEDLRFVYQIQTLLREWSENSATRSTEPPPAPRNDQSNRPDSSQ